MYRPSGDQRLEKKPLDPGNVEIWCVLMSRIWMLLFATDGALPNFGSVGRPFGVVLILRVFCNQLAGRKCVKGCTAAESPYVRALAVRDGDHRALPTKRKLCGRDNGFATDRPIT
jgi:hypothetical protein